MIYIFKIIRHLVDRETVKFIYLALCQSILSYCIPIWGGAGSTLMLSLERAQRTILKIMTHKRIRYPTNQLYSECGVLTVRQLFILRCVLRKHASLPLDINILDHRRASSHVCPTVRCRAVFAKRQYTALSSKLYNQIHTISHIYTLNKFEVKNKITRYLLNMSYIDTEGLLK